MKKWPSSKCLYAFFRWEEKLGQKVKGGYLTMTRSSLRILWKTIWLMLCLWREGDRGTSAPWLFLHTSKLDLSEEKQKWAGIRIHQTLGIFLFNVWPSHKANVSKNETATDSKISHEYQYDQKHMWGGGGFWPFWALEAGDFTQKQELSQLETWLD